MAVYLKKELEFACDTGYQRVAAYELLRSDRRRLSEVKTKL